MRSTLATAAPGAPDPGASDAARGPHREGEWSAPRTPSPGDEKPVPDAPAHERTKRLRKLERSLARAEERLVNYERLVDRTQHLLNTRIAELEAARVALAVRTEELEESEERFRRLTEASFEAILIHDFDCIIDCNDAAAQLYRMRRSALLGASLMDRIEDSFHAAVRERLDEPTDEPMELFHVRGDGTKVAVEVRTKRIQEHGRPALVTAVRDITAHKKLRAKLKRLAVTDPLTGVNNMRRLMKSGRRERERSLRHGHHLSVMMIDVDHFKRINDRFGHDNGDTALRELARIATKLLRSSDVFARLGGEEFAALLPETDADGALTLAQRLRARVEECSIETDLGPLRFTISIGVSTFEDGDRSIKVPLGRADKALYAAKRAGRNRVRRA